MTSQDQHQHRRFSLFNLIVNNKKKDNIYNQTTNTLDIENKNKLDAFYSNTSKNGTRGNNLNNNNNYKFSNYPYSSPNYNKEKRYSSSTTHKSNTLSVVEGARWGSLYVEQNGVLKEEIEDKSMTWRNGKVALDGSQVNSTSTNPMEFRLNKSEIYYRHIQNEDDDEDDDGDNVDGVCLRKKSIKREINMKERDKMEEREGDVVSIKSKTRGSLKRFFDMFSKNKNAYNNDKKENYTNSNIANLKYNTLKSYTNNYSTLPSASFLLGTSNRNTMAPLKPPRTSFNERHLLKRRTFSTTILEDEITSKPVDTELHDFQVWSCQENLNNPHHINISENNDLHGNEISYGMKTKNNHYDNINFNNNRYKKKDFQSVKLRRKSEDLKSAGRKENRKGVSNVSHVSMSDVSLPLQGHSPQTPPSYNNTLSEVMKTMMVKSYSDDKNDNDYASPMKTSSLSRIIESPISHHHHYCHKPNNLHLPHPNSIHSHLEDEIPFHYENNNFNYNSDIEYVRNNDNDINHHSSSHHSHLTSDFARIENESMMRMSKSLEPQQLHSQLQTLRQEKQPPQQLQQKPQQIWQQQRQMRLQQQILNNQEQKFNSEKKTYNNKNFDFKQTLEQQNNFIRPELNFSTKHNNTNNNTKNNKNTNNTNYFSPNISDDSSLKTEINFSEAIRQRNKSKTTLKNKIINSIENTREDPCFNNNNNGNQSEKSEINRILHANNKAGINLQSNNYNNNKPDLNNHLIVGSLTLGLPNTSRLIRHGLNDPRRTVLEGKRSQTSINHRSSENVGGLDKKEMNKNQNNENNFNGKDKGDNCSDDNVYGKVGVNKKMNNGDFSNDVLNQKHKNETARKLFFENSSHHHPPNQNRDTVDSDNNETSHVNISMNIKHTNFLSQLSYEPKLLKNNVNIENNSSNNNNDKCNNRAYDEQFDAFKESKNSGICKKNNDNKNKSNNNNNNNNINNFNNNILNNSFNNDFKSSKSEFNCENNKTNSKSLQNALEFSSNNKNAVMSKSDFGGFVDEKEGDGENNGNDDKGYGKISTQTYPSYNKWCNSNNNLYNDSNIYTNNQTLNNNSFNPNNNKNPDQNIKKCLNNNSNVNTNFANKKKYNKFRIYENENSKRESLDSGFDLRFEDRNTENHRNPDEFRKNYFGKMSSQSCSSPLLSTCHIPFDFNLTPFNPELSYHTKNAFTSTNRNTHPSSMEKSNLPISKIEKEVCIFKISESKNEDLFCFFRELCSKLISIEETIGVISQDSHEISNIQSGMNENDIIIAKNNNKYNIEFNKNDVIKDTKNISYCNNEMIIIEKDMKTSEEGGLINNEFCLSKLISESKTKLNLINDKISTNVKKNNNLNIENIVNEYLWNHLPGFFVNIFCEDSSVSCLDNRFKDKNFSINATKNTSKYKHTLTNTDSDTNTNVEIHKNTIVTTATPQNKSTDVDITTTKLTTQTTHPDDNLNSLKSQSEELMTSLRSNMHDHVIKCVCLRKQVLKEIKVGLNGKLMRRLKCFCRESDNLSKLLVLLLRQAGRCDGSNTVCSDEIRRSNGDIGTCSGVQEVLTDNKLKEKMKNGYKNNVERNGKVSGDIFCGVKSKFDVKSHEKYDKEEEDFYFKYIDENSSGDERGEKKKMEINLCAITENKKVSKNEHFENFKNSTSYIKSESMRSFYLNAEESESESDEEEFGNIGDILIPVKEQKLTELKLKIEDAIYLKSCIEGKGMVLRDGMVESGVGWRGVKHFFDLNSCIFFIPIMVLCVEEGYRGKR